MAYAINLRSENGSARSLESLWDEASQFESMPSMRATNYPPHITLAVYDDISLEHLYAGAKAASTLLKSVCVKFQALSYFEAPHALILSAVPSLPPSIPQHTPSFTNRLMPIFAARTTGREPGFHIVRLRHPYLWI